MAAFTFRTVPDIRFGAGKLAELPDCVARLGAKSALLVSDPGLVACGITPRAQALLEEAGIAVSLFTEVQADPKLAICEAAATRARGAGSEAVIGLGGGSALDVAKLAALLAHPDCTQPVKEMYGVDLIVSRHRLPLVQCPTTAGTGSEVTAVSIITDPELGKRGIVSPLLLADCALLDPELTLSLPPAATAATGLDSMVHAIEAFTTRHLKNDYSDMLAIEAMNLMCPMLLEACQNGQNIEARSAMMQGAMLAGQAFANAPVGGIHALAMPLGDTYGLPHGVTTALMLVPLLRYNMPNAAPLYAEMVHRLFPGEVDGLEDEAAATAMIDWFTSMLDMTGLPANLTEAGVKEEDIDALADAAMGQTRLLGNNPRDITRDDAVQIYRDAM